MREEYIDYRDGLPLDIYLVEVENYPLHWHDAIEIVFMLEGSLEMEIGTDSYKISQGEIEIVNHNEIHSLRSDGDNLALIVNIDPDFFESYYEGAREIFFYADSSDRSIQESERYVELRKFLAQLYYEFILDHEEGRELIEEKLLAMMYHLLNNFHYLFYEEESLREDELELERYHRIVSYISNNYMERVSLKEIADQEFLTSQYLSYKIKNTFGYGFNDFLNLTRVEESLKLLLNTDKNISEISEEVGFSHVRYYNKHFRVHYDMSPMEYRKKYQVDDEELERLTILRPRRLEDGLSYLETYLKDYGRYEYEDRIESYEIDLAREGVASLRTSRTVSLARLKEALAHDREFLREALEDLDFSHAYLEDWGDYLRRRDYHYLERALDLIDYLNLSPAFDDDLYEEELEDFLSYISKSRKDLGHLDYKKLDKEVKPVGEVKSSGLKSFRQVLREELEGEERIVRLLDSYPAGEDFLTGPGLITFNGLKKPAYYGYSFLASLSEEIIYRDDFLLVTRWDRGFQILIFDLEEDSLGNRGRKKTFSLNLSNLDGDYSLIAYEIDESASVYTSWETLGCPKHISRDWLDLLKRASQPKPSLSYVRRETVYNIVGTVRDAGANLYIFERVE